MKFVILTFISAFLLCGCSLIEERGDCPVLENDDPITISFVMHTSEPNLESRTDLNTNHTEAESEYRQFEDGIDMKDCALFVFAKNNGTAGDEKLILKKTDLGASNDIDNYITGAPGLYTVSMVISKSKLEELLETEVNPNSDEKINFRILILANCVPSGTNNSTYWNQINGTTYTEVINKLNLLTFAMSNIYNPAGGNTAVDLYKNGKQNVPMFGTNVTSVSQEALYYSRFDQRVYLNDVDLLRAVAKVRVVDNIQNKAIDGYPKVIGAEFIGSQSDLRQLPVDAANYQNGYQVEQPNIADLDKELTLTDAPVYKLGTIPDNWSITDTDNMKGSTWIGYVPEQKIGNLNNNVAEGMPIFRIKVAIQKNEDGSEETKSYDILMTDYNSFGQYILRNHVYSLSVNEVALGNEASLTFTVEEWIENGFSMNYTETVTVYPKLEWLSGFTEHDTEGNVVIKPWTTNPETGVPMWVPLTARFGLQSPVGATWSAYLITIEGAPNTFVFLDNGEMKPSVSGTITGTTLSDLIIVSQDDTPSGEGNRARLQVVITLGNGTVMEADLTPEGTNYKNYTIVQNPL